MSFYKRFLNFRSAIVHVWWRLLISTDQIATQRSPFCHPLMWGSKGCKAVSGCLQIHHPQSTVSWKPGRPFDAFACSVSLLHKTKQTFSSKRSQPPPTVFRACWRGNAGVFILANTSRLGSSRPGTHTCTLTNKHASWRREMSEDGWPGQGDMIAEWQRKITDRQTSFPSTSRAMGWGLQRGSEISFIKAWISSNTRRRQIWKESQRRGENELFHQLTANIFISLSEVFGTTSNYNVQKYLRC